MTLRHLPGVGWFTNGLLKDKIRLLSQYVRISRMGSMEFENTIIALRGLQQLGEREFQEGKVEEWTQLTMQGQDTIKFSNQYFTPRSQSIKKDSIPFSMDVDPNSMLQRLAGMQWIHAEDNKVRYYRGIVHGGKKSMGGADVQSDIVEVQTSMVFVKDKRGRVKMKTILRAIAMVNCNNHMENIINQYHPDSLRIVQKRLENHQIQLDKEIFF
ncbi:hypothetical protein IW262DRAFT_1302604 [Armillaria fumosa]|nr:hypothetical protein IW262DRAFT_1302604 [Armillaria fumosa]